MKKLVSVLCILAFFTSLGINAKGKKIFPNIYFYGNVVKKVPEGHGILEINSKHKYNPDLFSIEGDFHNNQIKNPTIRSLDNVVLQLTGSIEYYYNKQRKVFTMILESGILKMRDRLSGEYFDFYYAGNPLTFSFPEFFLYQQYNPEIAQFEGIISRPQKLYFYDNQGGGTHNGYDVFTNFGYTINDVKKDSVRIDIAYINDNYFSCYDLGCTNNVFPICVELKDGAVLKFEYDNNYVKTTGPGASWAASDLNKKIHNKSLGNRQYCIYFPNEEYFRWTEDNSYCEFHLFKSKKVIDYRYDSEGEKGHISYPNGDSFEGTLGQKVSNGEYKLWGSSIIENIKDLRTNLDNIFPYDGSFHYADGKIEQYIKGKSQTQIAKEEAERQRQQAEKDSLKQVQKEQEKIQVHNALVKKYGEKFAKGIEQDQIMIGMTTAMLDEMSYVWRLYQDYGSKKVYVGSLNIWGEVFNAMVRVTGQRIRTPYVTVVNGKVTGVVYR